MKERMSLNMKDKTMNDPNDKTGGSCDSAVLFSELWIGDRFDQGDGMLWTKVSHNTARQHSLKSVSLHEKGYGYVGDTVCSFEEIDPVFFIPPNS